MECYAIMTVGDWSTGRTCFNRVFCEGTFPDELIPLAGDRFVKEIKLGDHKTVAVCAYEDDCCAGEDYDRLRPLSYPGTNVFIAFFSVASRKSLESVKNRWIPEVREYCPKVPIIIVGNKIDLRNVEGNETVSTDEGLALAREMGTSYYEVSSKEKTGVEDCFKLAVELAELNSKKRRKMFKQVFKKMPIVIPPIRPIPAPAPVIKPAPSTFADDWGQMIYSPKFHDIIIKIQGGKSISAHQLVLCTSSPFFHNILISHYNCKDDIDSGKVQGLQKFHDGNNGEEMTLELSNDIKAETFDNILKFLYTGSLSGNTKKVDISELKKVAQMFEMNELDVECDSLETDGETVKDFSFSDVLKPMAMRKYFKQDRFSDLVFNIEGKQFPAHKVVICARCPRIAELIDSQSDQGDSPTLVNITDTSVENFSILLEYLYTDEADVNETSDLIGLIALANKYEAYQLVTICEVKLKTLHTIDEDSVIGLLQTFKAYKTMQLVDFCRHFICHNYSLFSDKEEFSKLDADDKNYIEYHKWPSLEYEREREAFFKNMAELENDTTSKCIIF